jgi:hypothetical protein
MEEVANLNEAIANSEDKPDKERLRSLGRGLSGGKGNLMSLGRSLMLSQDPSLVAGAHELIKGAKNAIWTGQQRVRAALQRKGAASDIS